MTDENQQKLEYRQNAQPGTLFYRIGWDRRVSKVKVDRVTKTILTLEDGTRLSRKHGLTMKEGYFLSQADYEPVLPFVTKQLEEEEEHRQFLAKYNKTYQEILGLLEHSYSKATDTQKRVDLLELFDKIKVSLENL